jgi:hypothetical protein
MTDNPRLAAALAYAERGWSVFACKPGLKVPATPHGVKDATTNTETLAAWWTRWPDANIALACGPVSGVYVVDVDLDVEKAVDGWKSLEAFPDLPLTLRQDSPRGGAHFLFRSATPVRNKNSFRNGIDVRAEGYYIMLAPSIHPNGKVYAWAPDLAPGEIELAEFPDFMRPTEPEKAPAPWEKPAAPAPKASTSPASTPILERARLYLQECEPALQGQAGHDKLLWAARALVVGFELDEGSAITLLWSDFNPRCSPPWDRAKPGDAKDFERKVAEARRTPGKKPRGWLLDELGLRGHDEALVAYGQSLAAGLLAGEKKPEPQPAAEAIPEILSPRKRRPTSSFPDWILNPPGLVGQLTEWINATAGCFQPLLALGCSLTAAGALFGRKVRDQSDGRTNLYMMGVAPSSAGKDHPADCIEQLFSMAGAAHYLGGNRVTSDSAIEVALLANPVQLFTWDEVGHMFHAIRQAGGSGGAQHLKTIVPALMQLYSSAHKLYVGKQRAEEEVRRIDQPHVCVWGLTSPDVLYTGLSTAELRDGWLGRVVTVISHDRPKYQIMQAEPPPESLISMIQAWLTRQVPPPESMSGDIRSVVTCHQITIPTQPTALRLFEEFRDECHEKMMRCDELDDDTQFLWGKGLQNARRIALIVAAGDRFDGAEITEFHAKYGCMFIRSCIEMFRESIRNNLSDNQWEADKQSLLKVIAKAGATGISKKELTKRTQSIKDRRQRDAYLADMVEAGLIVIGIHPGHPDARAGWLWKAPHGLSILAGGEEE